MPAAANLTGAMLCPGRLTAVAGLAAARLKWPSADTLFNVCAQRVDENEWLLAPDYSAIAQPDITFVSGEVVHEHFVIVAWVNCGICDARHSWYLSENNRVVRLPYGRSTFVTSALLPGDGLRIACRKHLAEFAEVKTKFAAMAWMEGIDVR